MSAGDFRPAPWLRGPHRQTLFAYLLHPRPRLAWRHERLELPDGDFVDLAHLGDGEGARVCLFHGLEGNLRSHYVGGLARALVAAGLRVTFMHFRGCSGEPNRRPRAYHSGETGDIGFLIATLRQREPGGALAAVGFSLGGNALLKYLGERGDDTPLAAAVAVSVPFDLDACATRIDTGFSRVYQARLVRRMKRSTRARLARLGNLPIDVAAMERARSFRAFDDCVTAPLHGFAGAADYYARASSGPWLPRIRVPVRIIQARDDPFVGPVPIPGPGEVSATVELDVSDHGGHVGFVAGRGMRPAWWLEDRIPAWLAHAPATAARPCHAGASVDPDRHGYNGPVSVRSGRATARATVTPEQQQASMIRALGDPARYPHAVDRVEHRETHISHVLLAGEYAYKIKKPLDLGFLDFSTLERRRFYCDEELRLNGRLAPSIYLDVVAITGTADDPVLGGDGEAIEYAVRMRRFPESGLLDHRLETEGLAPETIDDIVRQVAAFHEDAPATGSDTDYGSPAAVIAPMRENFAQLRPRVTDADEQAQVEQLARWTEETIHALRPALARRRADGRVRECHGDMHLGNMAFVGDGVAIFDGIEFNAHLRWIDVASDIAFLVMDLDHRGAPALAGRALDAWLAATGDYDALAVMRLYLVYRALVRAKIAAIRREQSEPGDAAATAHASLRDHLELAARYAAANAPAVLITRGISGSGKSTAAAEMVARIGAVRIRSDVERRRLFPDPDPAIRYAPEADTAVYARLEALAARAVEAGFPVVVDATFIEHERRAPFARLAAGRAIPFRILDLRLPPEAAARRIEARARAGTDPSEADRAIALAQCRRLEPLDTAERNSAVAVDNSGDAPVVPATGLAHARGLAPDG